MWIENEYVVKLRELVDKVRNAEDLFAPNYEDIILRHPFIPRVCKMLGDLYLRSGKGEGYAAAKRMYVEAIETALVLYPMDERFIREVPPSPAPCK